MRFFVGVALQPLRPSTVRHASTVVGGSPTGQVIGTTTSSKRPIGGFRGALTGFALGIGVISSCGCFYLLQEYHTASQAMRASIRELEESTWKVKAALTQMAALESDVRSLASSSCTKEEMRSRTGDLVRLYDGLHEDILEVRGKVWDVEQDINGALGSSKSRQANGRIV